MLRIGHLQFDFPVVQAALAGYSYAPMRRLARHFGAPYTHSPVVLDKSVALSPKARRRLLGTLAPDDHPIAGQLMGATPDVLADATEHLIDLGYDVIDLNFACPVRKVLGRCRGGYLLSDPATAVEILRAVRSVVPPHVPLTLKMRRGMKYDTQSERDFFQIFDAAWTLGVAAITVHPRSVIQRYRGVADWSFLTRLKRIAGDRTILGSGDLYTPEQIRRMLDTTGVDGVSVARGCIGNPWIFRETRCLLAGEPLPEPPSVPAQGRVIREHYELAVAEHGAERAGRMLRKFGIKYAELHPYAGKVRQAFVAVHTADEWHAVLDEWYTPERDWPPGVRKRLPSELVASYPCA